MGNCLSPQQLKMARRNAKSLQWHYTVKIIHYDGKLQEFDRPVRASEVISQSPGCFICCSEYMFIGKPVPQMSENEELQVGQIYFVMPLSRSRNPLSLQEMCGLAIKASVALRGSASYHSIELQGRAGEPLLKHKTK